MWNFKFWKKGGILAALVLAVFAGFHVRISREQSGQGLAVGVPDFSGVADALQTWASGTPHITIADPARVSFSAGSAPLNAASASDWAAVRQSATWANNNSNLADNIIMALKNAGLLKNSGTFTNTAVINGVTYKIKLETGGSFNASGTAAGSTAYSNKFRMWRASDNLVTLQLYFNNVDSPSGGMFLFYRLAVLSPTVSNNENLIVESYISGTSPSRKQTYSWGAAFWTSGANAATTSVAGRVILEEMTLGLVGGGTNPGLCVKIISKTTPLTGCAASTAHYYVLAYGQKTTGGLETTAKAGLHTSIATAVNGGTGGACGANNLNYGLFNSSGFLQDRVSSGSVPTGYPSPLGGGYSEVDTLFNEFGNAGGGTWDSTTTVMVDTTLATIAFPDTSAPGF